MKKVLVAGAALMLVSGIASTASAAAVTPGVTITGDARVRLAYKNDAYDFNSDNAKKSETNMDNRVRLNVKGTAAGGAYAFARFRLMENLMGDMDTDLGYINSQTQNNVWVDQAFMGIPFTDTITLEMGKYRTTYGPQPLTNNFFYDDVNSSGFRGTVKFGDVTINPFVEWMDEAQNATFNPYGSSATATNNATDKLGDNDEMRFGVHASGQINKDWKVGGMLGFQKDNRTEYTGSYVGTTYTPNVDMNESNDGMFGSIYVAGKSGAFGLIAELAFTSSDLNGFNSWIEDGNYTASTYLAAAPGNISANNIVYGDADSIGSEDTGFGGYIFPTYTIDKLTLGLNAGFTQNGFLPDRAYGFVMLGGLDNSWITAQTIGATGDWLWGGLVVSYQFTEALKLTGNLVFADVDPWTNAGDGPSFTAASAASANTIAIDSAWELSAVLQYTISKGMDVYFQTGYLDVDRTYINYNTAALAEDAAFGAMTRFELKF